MSFRITVRGGRGQVAQREYAGLYDPSNDAQVVAAAQAVCEAVGRSMPDHARIRVELPSGRRWKFVREVTT